MPAYYDSYDYPSYWTGREYEHKAEVIAIKSLLIHIPKVDTIVEIGSGYGRLVPTYLYRAKKVILTDPSIKLLNISRKNFKNKKIFFIHSCVENIHPKIRRNTADLVVLVRVLHHIENLDKALNVIEMITKKQGYLILEFANKRHFKATLSEFIHGNFTYLLDIFPKEVGLIPLKKKKTKTIPFNNFHPDVIKEKLKTYGYSIIDVRSVSNIRSPLLKKIFSDKTLLSFEKVLQKPLSYISFGPSIFILARKRS